MKKILLFLMVFMMAAMFVSAQPTMPVLADQTVDETQTVVVEINLIAGPDNGATTWSSSSADFNLITSNDTYAKFAWATDYSDAGIYSVTFTAADADSSDSDTITVTVNNVNRLPSISSSPVTTAVQGHVYIYDVQASDLDGETLTYLLSVAPAGMIIDSSTGVITWTPTLPGTVPVTVQVSDGIGVAEQSYNVIVAAPSVSMSISEIILGSSSQSRDEIVSETFIVTNTGTEAINNVVFTHTAKNVYNLMFSPATFSLNAGESKTVTIQSYIPLDQDAERTNIGVLTAAGTSASGAVSATQILYVEAENNLEIKNVDITVNGDSSGLDDGDSIDVFPASEIIVEVEIKNTHSNLNIEDITVEIYNDDLDIDEDDDLSRLKGGAKDTISFSFTIDEDADEDNYDVVIRVYGEDEEGAMHEDEWEITFDLKEEGIIIAKAELIPETLICGKSSVDLKLTLANVGDREEDEAVVEIVADSLDFEKRVSPLSIDEKDEIIRTYQIIVPKDATPGQHVIQIQTFQNFDELTHTKYLYLNVPSSCSSLDEDEPDDEPDDDVIDDGSDVDDGIKFIDVGIGSTKKDSTGLFSSTWATILLVLANILVLLIIVILIVRFLAR